jgi:hypothetical protein
MNKRRKYDTAQSAGRFCAERLFNDIIKIEDQNDYSNHFSSHSIESNCIMSRKRPTADWQTVLREERMRRTLRELAKFSARRAAEEDFKQEVERETLLSRQRRKKLRDLHEDTTKK